MTVFHTLLSLDAPLRLHLETICDAAFRARVEFLLSADAYSRRLDSWYLYMAAACGGSSLPPESKRYAAQGQSNLFPDVLVFKFVPLAQLRHGSSYLSPHTPNTPNSTIILSGKGGHSPLSWVGRAHGRRREQQVHRNAGRGKLETARMAPAKYLHGSQRSSGGPPT